MIHNTKFASISLLWLAGITAACSHIGLMNVTQETLSFQGKLCSNKPPEINGFVERYLSNSKVVQGEIWTELEFYECSAKGIVLVNGSRFQYDINASGAGILWQQTKNGEVKKLYYCDSSCRKSMAWPFDEESP